MISFDFSVATVLISYDMLISYPNNFLHSTIIVSPQNFLANVYLDRYIKNLNWKLSSNMAVSCEYSESFDFVLVYGRTKDTSIVK